MYSVSQKKDIKRQKEKLEAMKREAEEEKEKAKEAARERVLLDFERSQLALAGGPIAPSTKSTEGASSSDCEALSSIV
jgi:nitric oxide synthase-interacting protein